jgi:hypothetical protein
MIFDGKRTTIAEFRVYGRKGGQKRSPNKGFGSNKERARLAGVIAGAKRRRNWQQDESCLLRIEAAQAALREL